MRNFKTLKKALIITLLTTAITAGLLSVSTPIASAEDKTWCQQVQENKGLGININCGEDQITFSQFKGGFTPPNPEGYAEGLKRVTTVRSFILTFVNFALSFLGLIAVVMVIYGGFLYVTARGEQEQADKGKKSIQYAVIGILIILISFALVNTLLTEAFDDPQDGTGSSSSSSDGTGGAIAGGGSNSSGATHSSSGLSGIVGSGSIGGSLAGYNSLTTKVNQSASSLIEMYSTFQAIQKDVGALDDKIDKFEVTANGFSSIMAYLNNAKSVLSQIQNAVPFGSTNIQSNITSAIKSIDDIKDSLEQTKADDLADADFGFGQPNSSSEENPIVKKWDESKDSISSEYDNVLQAAKEDLGKLIITAQSDLEEIGKSISGQLSEVSSIVSNLKSDSIGLGALKSAVDAEQKNTDNIMLGIVSMYGELFQALANVQFVRAVINADVIEGHAPLLVNFNMLDSIDPTGVTINDSQISWDLDGNGVFGSTPSASVARDCEESSTKKTFVACTYVKPGTYLARVKVDSSQPNENGSGQAALAIKVLPPTAKIGLKISSGQKPPTNMIEYDSNTGSVLFEKKSVKFTLNEAKAGISFDSSSSTSEDEITSFSYDFGDGTTDESGDNKQPVSHAYGEAGTYKTTFTVKDSKGKVNRKIFDVIVGSPVARVLVSPPTNTFLGEEILFNGTTSSSEVGQITSYNWTILDLDDGPIEAGKLTLDGKPIHTSEEASFRYKFEEDGQYKVVLNVTDSLGENDFDFAVVNVTSQAPVSRFSYKIPKDSQPSTVQFFGNKSFDPDGDVTDSSKYNYKWSITPDTFTPVEGTEETLNRTVRFDELGEYKVSLLVQDEATQGEAFEKTIVIDDLLDLKWTSDDIAKQLDNDSEAQIAFSGESLNGIAYELEFGDGEFEAGEINGSKFSEIHTYTEAGKYDVTLTVFDEDDNDKSIRRKIFIGDGNNPKAAIKVFIDGDEKSDLDKVEVNRSSVLTFDAGDSKNIDGTGRKLSYAWDFDDTTISTKKTATHTYDEITNKGYYQVKLTVADKDDQAKDDYETVKIHVISEDPELLGLTAVPQSADGKLETPLKVKVQAIGAEDKDGDIVKYRWYYYPTSSSSEELGVQITESPTAFLNIGTRGKAGKDVTYKFNVEMTDNENNTVEASDYLSNSELPTLTVTNGPNELPTAKFKVDRTNIFTGESVTFSSESSDPDGEIESYVWDVEGDGFANNKTTNKSTFTHTYEKKSEKAIPVRLKVIDDKFGEAVSEPINIFVESATEPPKAAFKYKLIGEKAVKFENNSTTTDGPSIKDYIWDFDTSSADADSDGDGVKDNDSDSTSNEPSHEFPDYGVYKVKLTVIDADSNEDSVENFVNIPKPAGSELPKAAFKYEIIKGNKVKFINNSKKQAGPSIKSYIWDFDIASLHTTADSDGDGVKENDTDSTSFEPEFEYPATATFQAKLTVIDAKGNEDSVINFVDLANPDPSTTVFGNNLADSGLATPSDFGGSTAKLDAKLLSNPSAQEIDNKIHLIGDSGIVTFDFSTSTGEIAKYTIDKNIFFDTDGNGIPNDDKDMESLVPGTWKTNFEKAWGKIVVKLTVHGKDGQTDNVLKEITFDNPGAASIVHTNSREFFTALVVLIAFVILSLGIYRYQKK